jgi:hypothetical protein
MLYIGDHVTHNTFPPIEGYVSIIRPGVSSTEVGVVQSTGIIFYDDISSWDLLLPSGRLNQTDVIDVEYEVVEEDDEQ